MGRGRVDDVDDVDTDHEHEVRALFFWGGGEREGGLVVFVGVLFVGERE